MPEMSLTGFSMHTDRTKESKKETVKKTRELAEKYQITIGIGWVKDMGSLCENHYSLVAPEGELLDYAKIHPFRYVRIFKLGCRYAMTFAFQNRFRGFLQRQI